MLCEPNIEIAQDYQVYVGNAGSPRHKRELAHFDESTY